MKHKYRLQVVFSAKNTSFYTASCKYAVHWDIMAFFGKACNFYPFQMREAKAFPPKPIGPAPLETIRRERDSECGDHSPSYGIHGYIFYIINGTRRFCQPEGRSASPEISPAGLDAPGKARKTPLRTCACEHFC